MNHIRHVLLFIFLLTVCLLPRVIHAQGTIPVRRSPTVPVNCDPNGLTGNALIWKTSTTTDTCSSSKGLCECTAANTWTFRIGASGTLGAKAMLYSNAAGLVTTTAAPTDGQFLMGSTGNIPVLAALTNTANETLITNGAGSITLGLAAILQHKAGANFLLTDTTDTTKKFQFDVSNVGAGATRTVNIPNANSTTAQPLTAVDGLLVNSISAQGVPGTATAEQQLSTTAAVNMNTGTATTLYTCPSGRTCVITRVTVRNASASLTTASWSYGWNSATFNDVIANATHVELTGATLYTILNAKVGATVGTSTGVFKVLMNTLQGGAATTTMDVYGYTF